MKRRLGKRIRIGQRIYTVVDLDNQRFVDALTVTEVGTRYVFVSDFAVPRDDLGESFLLSEEGKEWFLTYGEAQRKAGQACKGEDGA